jgi:hypothetical protein
LPHSVAPAKSNDQQGLSALCLDTAGYVNEGSISSLHFDDFQHLFGGRKVQRNVQKPKKRNMAS